MGQMVNRRRVEGSALYTKEGYIKKGLVFHLDGLNYGGVGGHWIDLKQNCDFVLPATVTKTQYGFVFIEDDTHSRAILDGTLSYPDYRTATIQLCFRDNIVNASGSSEHTIFNTLASVPGPYIRYSAPNNIFTSKNVWVPRNITVPQDGNNMVNSTLSIASIGYVNGQAVTPTNRNGGYGPGTNAFIAGLKNQTICYCAIRMYDRVLTESEILHNQRVDNERFNLGLTI